MSKSTQVRQLAHSHTTSSAAPTGPGRESSTEMHSAIPSIPLYGDDDRPNFVFIEEVKSRSTSLTPSSGVCPDSAFDAKTETKEVRSESSPAKKGDVSLALVKPMILKRVNPRRGFSYTGLLGTTGVVTTGATGVVNTAVNNSSLASTPDFTSFAAVFDEFFIHSMTMFYQPLNQYMTQPSMSFTAPASGIILVAPLYHGAAAYTTTASMANNVDLRTLHSAQSWTATWVNNESPKAGSLPSASTSAPIQTQAWQLTASSNAALYTGFLQLRNSTAFTGALSSTIGDSVVRWKVTFRARV